MDRWGQGGARYAIHCCLVWEEVVEWWWFGVARSLGLSDASPRLAFGKDVRLCILLG